jgi:hypothetical protein
MTKKFTFEQYHPPMPPSADGTHNEEAMHWYADAAIATVVAGLPQWRPIETAPRDGSEFLAYGTLHGTHGYTPDEKSWTGAQWNGGRVVSTKPGANYDSGWTFTHWCPLPALPGPVGEV